MPLLALIGLVVWFLDVESRPHSALNEDVRKILKERTDSTAILNDKSFSSPKLLLNYYKKNDCTPSWIGKNGHLPIADSLIALIRESVFDGLNPSDYHLSAIESLQKELLKYPGKSKDSAITSKWADFEILLSDAFLTCALHQYAGRIHTQKYNTQWKDQVTSVNATDSLRYAVKESRIRETLNKFSCILPQYTKLKELLRGYIGINKTGGWTLLPQDPKLKIKDKNEKIVALRKRLGVSGELPQGNSDSLFDNTLEEAVKEFQRRHGLKNDGVVGTSTLKELNVPVERRIKQIALNMEKWRWFPRTQEPYILVNTAGFTLDVMESNESIMNMKIVAGMYSHRTPVIKADMTYLILNPWWEIPMSIARREMLPEMQKDTSYFTKSNINIYRSWKSDAKPVPVDSIAWDKLDSSNFNYRLRQTPGPWNAMGQIKFMLPNKYNIYLHDTPNKELFSKKARTYSHGCIRIEHPVELASYLLRSDTSWTKNKLEMAIDSKNEQTIVLPNSFKVYVCYYTVWVDKRGSFYFWKDVYDYDRELERLLPYRY